MKKNLTVHFSSETDLWATPQATFDMLNDEFGFHLDPCALPENAKCERYFTPQMDGLIQDWKGARVFCNPPYGREIGKWVAKCAGGGADLVVALLPSRTDTKWFHEYIYNKAEIRFIKGRLKFGSATNSAPFPSMIIIWRNKKND